VLCRRVRQWIVVGICGAITVPVGAAGLKDEYPPPFDVRSAMAVRGPEHALLLDASYTHAGSIVAVGEQGLVVVSRDGGSSWQQAVVPFDASITRLFFVDDTRGWAVGHDGAILHTKDGGSTWALQRLDPDMGGPLLGVYFADHQRGIVVGVNSTLLVTSDGGQTWHQGPRLNDEDDFELNLFDVAAMANGTLFIAAESGYVFRSTDGGTTWRRSRVPYKGSMFGITEAPWGIIVFGLLGHAFLSSDNGVTWQALVTGVDESLLGGAVTGNGEVVLVGLGGTAIRSHNGGTRFERISVPGRRPFTAVLPSRNAQDALLLFGGGGVINLQNPFISTNQR